jgi:SrtB family sortase
MAKKKRIAAKNSPLTFLAALSTVCAVVSVIVVVRYALDLQASRRELAALPVLPDTPEIVWSSLNFYNNKMLEINPDYTGVIRIEGTTVSYPVVRGEDNIKYLDTSFGGTKNVFGGLFMDYRCVGGEMPHIIIYGHHAGNIENGDRYFFGGLDGFLNERYREEHSLITLIENERLAEFEIFSARLTDINDPAYYLDFSAEGSYTSFLERNGAPPDAAQILTLSTCYGEGGDDRRIIVQGARKSVTPINEAQMMLASYDYSL